MSIESVVLPLAVFRYSLARRIDSIPSGPNRVKRTKIAELGGSARPLNGSTSESQSPLGFFCHANPRSAAQSLMWIDSTAARLDVHISGAKDADFHWILQFLAAHKRLKRMRSDRLGQYPYHLRLPLLSCQHPDQIKESGRKNAPESSSINSFVTSCRSLEMMEVPMTTLCLFSTCPNRPVCGRRSIGPPSQSRNVPVRDSTVLQCSPNPSQRASTQHHLLSD